MRHRGLTLAAFGLLLSASGATAQIPSHGWEHAAVPTELPPCEACHAAHTQSDGPYILKRAGDASQARAWLDAQAPGTGDVSASCLRCHWTDETRRREPEFTARPSGGGRFVGPDLRDDHPLGSTDPAVLRLRDARQPSLVTPTPISDRSVMECTMCHDPHTPGARVPRGAEQVALCGTCHSSEAALLRAHGVVACTGCHDVHGSLQPPLLYETTIEFMCTRCHASTSGPAVGWLDAQRAGDIPRTISPAHNPGTDCRQCHSIHSAR